MHPCEPTLGELQDEWRKLISAPSTNENIKRIEALDIQIARREIEEL